MIAFYIIGPEIGAEYPGDRRYYDKFLQSPTWPEGDSGVTVGFGFDLGYYTRDQIRKAWEGKVNGNVLSFMMSCAGAKGQNAKKLITSITRTLKVPYEAAEAVFYESTLPNYTEKAMNAYPGLEKLNEITQSIIVGLVYNRGASFGNPDNPQDWERRREMRELAPLIAAQDYQGIASKIDEMKRLWVNTKLTGLVTRREREAKDIQDSVA